MRFAAGLLAVTLGLTTTAWAAVSLESIEVVGTKDKLHLLLKSHQLVPARIISQQADEVVLELSNIDTRSPVATRFSGQNMVSHVSMQAVDNNRMRVVLRGEGLPEADIAFKPVSIPDASELFRFETPRGTVRPKAPVINQSAVVTPVVNKTLATAAVQSVNKPLSEKTVGRNDQLTDLLEPETRTAVKTPAKSPYASTPQTVSTRQPKPLFSELPPEPAITEQNDPYEPLLNALSGDSSEKAPKETATQTKVEPVALQAQAETQAIKQGLDWLHTYGLSMLGGILMAVAGGTLFWIFQKQPATNRVADNATFQEEDEYWDETPPEMPQRGKRQATRPGSRQDVLGLSAFHKDIEPYGRYGDDIPVHNHHSRVRPDGIRQYQKESGPLVRKPVEGSARLASTRLASQTVDTDLTREEIRRSSGIKHRSVEGFQAPKASRTQTAAQEKPRNGVRESLQQFKSGKAPLPANPEVLDFLKSVADYMDNQQIADSLPTQPVAKPSRPQR